MKLDKMKLTDFRQLHSLEWLETNGLGGYASSTVSGGHSRRYHGLLVAATHPPVGRMVLVSKLDETIVIGDTRYELSSNQYPGTVHPQGYNYLSAFERDLFPEFYYNAGDVELKKTIASIYGENTTVILYEVISAPPQRFNLELLPLYSCKDFHSLSQSNDSINKSYIFDNGVFQAKNYEGCPEFFISVPKSIFEEDQHWYRNFEYSVEQYRGLGFREDLYTHGKFSLELKKGDTIGIVLSTENPKGRNAISLFNKEKRRRQTLVKHLTGNDELKRLVLAADQFIVKRGEHSTVIAGYHWFADWGRDTMISLPGLCLTTGRYEDAKQILSQFAESVDKGMLPNRFPDYGEVPEYNTIDASLWFFHAIYKYYSHTQDLAFVKSVLPMLKDIIEWHYKGTRFNIHVDPSDELLSGGQDGVQLTWMDAKVGDWVVTPRKGKAVEINSLWYNALCIVAMLLDEAGEKMESEAYRIRSGKVFTSFDNTFWNDKQNCLYDYVDGDYRNDDIRPNQIYAVSLPFPLLTKAKAGKVVQTVGNCLLTPYGLRSQSQAHKDYKPVYGGGVWSRDGEYHQGTVWSFLLGPYIDALMAVKEDEGRTEAARILKNFYEHLDQAGVGTVSEIFDGDAPHTARGCIAQAWGVAEILRVAIEYDLISGPMNSKKEPTLSYVL